MLDNRNEPGWANQRERRVNCEKQFKTIMEQLDRIENAIESTGSQPPQRNRCCASSTFRAVSGGTSKISGDICASCDPIRSFIDFFDGTNSFRLDSVETTSCFASSNNQRFMAGKGLGIFNRKRVHFILFLIQEPFNIVFLRPSDGPNFVFIGTEVIELSLTECD